MILLYVFLLPLICWRLRPIAFNDAYLSRRETTSVKGVFTLLVFFSHFSGYVSPDGGRADALFRAVNSGIGQLMVVMFLFYSGYGIMCRILDRSEAYLQCFLPRRFCPTWLRFALCVLLYLILGLLTGTLRDYGRGEILLAFIGWTSIGNSNWFMFDTFCLYAGIVLIFGRLKISDRTTGLCCFSVLTLVLAALLSCCKASWWWGTLLCFPFGMWLAVFRARVEECMRQPRLYATVFAFFAAAFLILWLIQRRRGLGGLYVLFAPLFSMLVVLVTMELHIGNPVLDFFGRHLFSIYMCQRIPMILFQGVFSGFFIYFLISLVTTVLLAVCFDKGFAALQKRLTKTGLA